ncbi:MAG TPA: class I SAM-dependent methyltransferase [Conexibacter sp.]|nr:class I SAM-dependent methyltransferase [Conexibacter sp.]
MTTLTASPALAAYEQLAPVYDRFTAGYDHAGWIDGLLRIAHAHGQSGLRVLDVGCGTGKSFAPLLERGYDVWACDISPAMVARARMRPDVDPDRVLVADMRDLPALGPFDLVTCLDDAVNYLLSPADLAAAFASVARVLAPRGTYLFDVNSLATYRAGFAARATFERPLAAAVCRGETTGAIEPGTLCTASIEIAGRRGRRRVSRHVQRHHPEGAIRDALGSAGLACRAVLGQSTGAVLHADADEEVHTKLVYVACLAARTTTREGVSPR